MGSHRSRRRLAPRGCRTIRSALRRGAESLEGRVLLSAVSWTGGGDGTHWGDANNWSSHAVPGASDDVTINASASTVVQVNTGTQTVNSLTSSNTIQLNGATLSLAAASQVSQLNFSSGTLTGAGNLTVTGPLNWSGGTMLGTGTTVVSPTGALATSGTVLLDRTVEIDGSAASSGGTIAFDNGTLNITAGATFTATPANATFLDCYGNGGTNAVNNAGSFVNNGLGTSRFRVNNGGVPFNNTGSVSVQQGTLALSSGGTQTGSFTVAAGATLGLAGTHSFSSAATFSGSGTINVTNDTSTFAGPLNFSGTLQVSNPGEADLNADSTIGSLSLPAGGTLGGSGTVTFTGHSTWNGGIMIGTGTTVFPTGSNLTSAGGTVGRVVRIDGTATSANATLVFNNGTLNITGTFTATPANAGFLDCYGNGGTNAVNNSGTFINNGPGTTRFRVNNNGVPFNNTGSVSVQQGTLALSSGGTQTGSFAIAPGATLSLAGTHSFTPAATFSGSGTINVTNDTSTFAGPLNFNGILQASNQGEADLNANSTIGSLTLPAGGTIGGSGTVTFTGNSTWSGGAMSGTGTTVFPNGSNLAISAGGTVSRIVRIEGSATYTGGALIFNNGTLNIAGTFTATPASGQTLDSYGNGGTNAINNSGTFINNGPGTTRFRVNNNGVAFNNMGSVSVQQGTLNLNSDGNHTGSFAVAAGATLGLAGTHSFSAAVTLSGAGLINVADNVVPGTSTFAGPLNFNGTLQVSNPGEADLNANSTIGSLTLPAGGTLAGSGTVTFTGSSTWSGGIMSGTGTTVFPTGSNLTISSGGTVSRHVRVDGSGTMTGNNGTGAAALVFNNGTLNISGTFTATPSSGQIFDSYGTGGTNVINNSGTFINNGPGTTRFRLNGASGVAFNNTGSISVQQGTLNLSSGGTHTGSFAVAAGTTLGLAGVHSFLAAVTFSGAGLINVTANSANDTSTFAGPLNFNGTLQVSNPGEADLNANSTIVSLTLPAGGTLGGSGTVTFTRNSTWSSGAMSGTGTTVFPTGSNLTITSGGTVGRVVRIDGSAALTGNNGTGAATLVFNNGTLNITGTFTATPSSGQIFDSYGTGGTNAVNNSGTFINNGLGTTRFRFNGSSGVAFNNTGSLAVQQGTLNLACGGTHTGSFAVPATLILAGTHTFSSAASFSGGGTINVATDSITLAGLLNFPAGTLQLSNGTSATIQGAGTSMLSTLTLGTNAHLDLRTSSLTISYGSRADPVGSVRTWLKQGQLLGTGSPALGYADSADGIVAGLASTTVIIEPTVPGDLNLDHTVTFADLLRLAQHYSQTNDYWDEGDLNYDGTVAFADLLALAQHYGGTYTAAAGPAAAAASAVPAVDSLEQRRRSHKL